jgi:predicted nucleotidyltransferase
MTGYEQALTKIWERLTLQRSKNNLAAGRSGEILGLMG